MGLAQIHSTAGEALSCILAGVPLSKKKVGFLHKRFPKFNTIFSESVNTPMRSNEGGEKGAEITVLWRKRTHQAHQ